MKKSITITIPEPCHEDWATMTLTQKGKHCAVCEKEVIDFTKVTDEHIYKTAKKGGYLCGRFTKSQLDRPIQLQRKENKSWLSYAASLLLPITILATQEIKAQSNTTPTEQTDGNYKSLGISSLSRNRTREIHDHRESEALKQNMQDTLKKQQTRIIKGTVSEESGPLPGANIYIKGTDKGTQTDFDGNYELEVTTGDVLIFSYVGYKTIEVKITELHFMTATINTILDTILREEQIIIMGKLRLKESGKTPTKHS
ncbi:carboxypeptidase-like regulatory domain-containing protein [uncultured Dokdonia sp.]|uniref:carboxypeptidase-like regulatory domain-containing protein n=1 Tax=uncultured Dokdonia sp. TaxID=575653 RepID=UPI00262435B6|nr:carboxypeptidase-like regulatory domain-containing protein [uncultured Dokdonia sp.]